MQLRAGGREDLSEGYRLAPEGAAADRFADMTETMTIQLLLESFQHPGHQVWALKNPAGVELNQGGSGNDSLQGALR